MLSISTMIWVFDTTYYLIYPYFNYYYQAIQLLSETERKITKTCAAEDNEEDSLNYWICLHETQKYKEQEEQQRWAPKCQGTGVQAVNGSCTQRSIKETVSCNV